MRSKEEIRMCFAKALKELREKKGYTKSQIANELFLDPHTWSKYERGVSTPSATDFLWFFSELNEHALRPCLDIIYPDTYEGIGANSSADERRKAFTHFMETVASDRYIRAVDYITFGNHGSNIEPQLQMFLMINHMPLSYKFLIAETVKSLWEIGEAKGTLINTDCIMPDLDMFYTSLKKCKDAVASNLTSYNSSMED